ncbi:Clavaminate synthase-like protein [Aspergillus indologenus CBS 114.80]|uniref:Clavaminate synthase-like protein n=1 Tax=Aspergillus indologenus CBS 114.80 TaxID=1450541 RepID=A0A2V5I4N9_9EURO|nr:Clavaminate synthase-like protein [Aspergillus indologenus CBS 114.80]
MEFPLISLRDFESDFPNLAKQTLKASQEMYEMRTLSDSCVLFCFSWHMGLPKDFFTSSHQDSLPGNTLKFIKYPKLAIKPDDAVPCLTKHTDWGSITLLFTDSPGLELPGGIVINIGDALSLWTGQQLKSTMHCISWEKVLVDQDRYSMPCFVHPNFTTNLRSLRAPESMEAKEITYKKYYNFRMKLTWGSLQGDDGAGALEDVEKELLSYINSLGVTRTLESHALTRTEEVQ